MKFKFKIRETLYREINVEANDMQEAEDALRRDYDEERIVLDWSDFQQVEFIPVFQLCNHLYYEAKNFKLYQGDSFALMPLMTQQFDMIFADPPYFLSNGGFAMQSGKVVSADKGNWDKVKSEEEIDKFNMTWISECKHILKDDGTIWISGTYHNIFSVAKMLEKLDFKILNVITWNKTNPPANISCRMFKYSTEFIIWARKQKNTPHFFNYKLMKKVNNDKQMTDVWRMPSIAPWEKSCGKHPTQKPLSLLARIILASTKARATVFDPFSGSSTTGIAANLLGRSYVGIERESEFLDISKHRRMEISNIAIFNEYRGRIKDIENATRIL